MKEFLLISLITISVFGLLIKKKNNIVLPFNDYRHMNQIQKRVETILIILFIVVGILAAFLLPDYPSLYGIIFGFSAIFYGYRGYMEYKHDPKENNYLYHGFLSVSSLLVFMISIIFW